MKQILLLMACMFCLSAVSQAQTSDYNGKLTGAVQDTLTDTASDTLTMVCRGPKTDVTFQYNITKVSGTVGGTIKLYGSIDGGTHYALINSYTITDATFYASYPIATNPYTKYKLIIATTGTQVSAYEIWAMYRN